MMSNNVFMRSTFFGDQYYDMPKPNLEGLDDASTVYSTENWESFDFELPPPLPTIMESPSSEGRLSTIDESVSETSKRVVRFESEPVTEVMTISDGESVDTESDDASSNRSRHTVQSPPEPDNDDVKFSRGRAFLWNTVVPLIFFSPWIAGLILSCVPLHRIGLHEIPPVIIVNVVCSAVEVFCLVFYYGREYVLQWIKSQQGNEISMPGLLTLYLHLQPIGTGLYACVESARLECGVGIDTPICRIGRPLLLSFGCFRSFAIFVISYFMAPKMVQDFHEILVRLQLRQNARNRPSCPV